MKDIQIVPEKTFPLVMPTLFFCRHSFSLCLYVPPGKTVMVPCPHCGLQISITGSGAIC